MENNEYMDMKKILNIISSKKIFIALIILLSLVMSYFYSYYYKKPQYNSSVTVLLTGDEAQGEKQVTQTDLNLNSGLISTYGSIAKSANVLSKVIENLGLDISVRNLQKNLTVAEIKNTQFLKITVENQNPETAMKIANEISTVFVEQIKTIYNIQNINIIDTAEISNTPCNINHIKDMAIALMAGIFTSGVLILILYILDDTIKSEKDIPVNLKLETIGTIPNTNKTNNELIIETDPKSYIVECLKTTRTNILYASNINKKKAILFTSAREKEGKSFIVNNIAVAFAQANKKVLIVDTNLRNSKGRSQIFENQTGEGLSDFIKEITENKLENLEKAKKYIKETKIPNLHILESGTIPPNPSELLSSTNMRNLLELLKSMYDLVLLDGTPSMMVSDSIALSTMVDSTILIAENKVSKINELKKTKRQIQDVGGKIMGVILNKSDVQHNKYYGKGYGYYYGDGKQEKTQKEIQIKQSIITVSEIIENARPVIEQELLNKEVEQELENVQVVEQQQEKTIEPKENGFKNVIKKIFSRISNIEKRLDNDNSKEQINNIYTEIDNIKNKQSLDKQEIINNINNSKTEIFESINNFKEETKAMQNDIKNLQTSNNNLLENIEKLDLEKVNILEQINILKDNNSNMFENIDELISNKETMNEKINSFDEKVEQLKNEQLKAKADIENTVKELQTLELLKQKTQNMEEEFNQLEELKTKIELANKEIELLKQLQNEQITNVNHRISKLRKLQINNNKELLEKIEAINYDDKLTEINENILKSQEEYTKMIEEINNKNKPEEKPSNIISFESLKKKRKANKKVFSINENIMSDELETSSSYVIDLNSELFGIMAN
ncbi:MAG: polysaccharide biosynthesis tyrosine autokinase [Clostridia bacterium]